LAGCVFLEQVGSDTNKVVLQVLWGGGGRREEGGGAREGPGAALPHRSWQWVTHAETPLELPQN
jgi:hypothetical protein